MCRFCIDTIIVTVGSRLVRVYTLNRVPRVTGRRATQPIASPSDQTIETGSISSSSSTILFRLSEYFIDLTQHLSASTVLFFVSFHIARILQILENSLIQMPLVDDSRQCFKQLWGIRKRLDQCGGDS